MSPQKVAFHLRRMKESDIPVVHAIEGLSFSNPWSDATFRGEVQNKGISFPVVIVHEPGQSVAGYIIYWHIRAEVIKEGKVRTYDMKGSSTTLDVGRAVAAKL